MDLLGLNLWKFNILKQAKYLVSSPQKAQKVLEILETGVVGIEPLPMQTGFMKAVSPEVKKAWANIHALKFQIYNNGKPSQDEAALVISERSYTPLDPLNTLKQEERQKLASLKDIAKVRHAQARSNAGAMDQHGNLAAMVIQGGFVMLALMAVLAFARGCG